MLLRELVTLLYATVFPHIRDDLFQQRPSRTSSMPGKGFLQGKHPCHLSVVDFVPLQLFFDVKQSVNGVFHKHLHRILDPRVRPRQNPLKALPVQQAKRPNTLSLTDGGKADVAHCEDAPGPEEDIEGRGQPGRKERTLLHLPLDVRFSLFCCNALFFHSLRAYCQNGNMVMALEISLTAIETMETRPSPHPNPAANTGVNLRHLSSPKTFAM